jgi:hypothetical protein
VIDDWKRCITVRDFMRNGLSGCMQWYAATFGLQWVLACEATEGYGLAFQLLMLRFRTRW